MSKLIKSMVLSITGIFIIMLYIGCTPGKAQTRANDYKGNFGTEEYEAFDTDDNTGEDVILGYGNNSPKKQKTSPANNAYAENSRGQAVNRNSSGNGAVYNPNSAYSNVRSERETRSSGAGSSGNSIYVRNNSGADQFRTNRFYQKGSASWYGREFHGRKTASGEKLEPPMVKMGKVDM